MVVMPTLPRKILIAGGGTGGHLFAGIALAEEFQRRGQVQVQYVGTERGLEASVIPKRGDRLHLLPVRPLKGRTLAERVRGVAGLPNAVWQARSLLQIERPDFCVGVGGYASGPVLLAAALLRIPAFLLEQNAKAGMTNRWASRLVRCSYLTYANAARDFSGEVAVLGNPIRRAFVESAALPRAQAADPNQVHVVVLGGSQGSSALNSSVPGAIADAMPNARVTHQCGSLVAAAKAEVERSYREHNVQADVRVFIDDVAALLCDADVVVSRAGATGLSELSVIGRPSILVPLPSAADDHQTMNALAVAEAGAAILVRESEMLTALPAALRRVADPEQRKRMAAASRALGNPHAAEAIADDILARLAVSR